MAMERDVEIIEAYARTPNLKLVGEELGIPWQSIYVRLCKNNIPVIGDKKKYGSDKDKLARLTEEMFLEAVPHAIDMNQKQFQSKFDFKVGNLLVDIKASCKRNGAKETSKYVHYRWGFSTKVQQEKSDFLVCFCFDGYEPAVPGNLQKVLLIPKEYYENKTSFSASCKGSKWDEFEISLSDLSDFFSAFED